MKSSSSLSPVKDEGIHKTSPGGDRHLRGFVVSRERADKMPRRQPSPARLMSICAGKEKTG
ncbi:hypothetical protein [Parabacteroides sp.]